MQSVSQLGDGITINADAVKKIENLFCYLYQMPNETNINETRYWKVGIEKKTKTTSVATKMSWPNIMYVGIIKPMYGREL